MMTYDLDLNITKIERRAENVGGSWVSGTIDGFRFNALVFEDHAECEEYEIEGSRISKLWIQRLTDKKTVFNWDRGSDVSAADTETQVIVEFLCEGLAEFVFGE